jgi:hypothetical protein
VYCTLADVTLIEKEFSLTGVLRSVHEYARRIIKLEALRDDYHLIQQPESARESRDELYFVNRRLIKNRRAWSVSIVCSQI